MTGRGLGDGGGMEGGRGCHTWRSGVAKREGDRSSVTLVVGG